MSQVDPPRHLPQQFGKKPHARVRIINTGDEVWVPLHWFHRVQLARRSGPDKVLDCFYSGSLEETPNFRVRFYQHGFEPRFGFRYKVNVLEIVNGTHETSDDDTELLASEVHRKNAETVDAPNKDNQSIESEIAKALEATSADCVQTRITGLTAMGEALSKYYSPQFGEKFSETIIAVVERTLRHGNDDEQAGAGLILPRLALQIGESATLIQSFGAILARKLQDEGIELVTRARLCTVLTLLHIMNDSDVEETLTNMRIVKDLFDEASANTSSSEQCILQSVALNSSALLVSLIPSSDFCTMMQNGTLPFPSIYTLFDLLESNQHELRISAARTIALVLEKGRHHDNDFLDLELPALLDALQELNVDSKYHAKCHFKIERKMCRDLRQYVDAGIVPSETIRFGSESLLLDTWAARSLYAELVSSIGSLNGHLSSNEFLRDVFELESGQAKFAKEVELPLDQRNRKLLLEKRTRTRTNDRRAKAELTAVD